MISTIRRVPVDLIIHTLAERFKDSTEEGHEALAMGLYACIDSNTLAEEWATSSGVAQAAMWIGDSVDIRTSVVRSHTAAETRVAEVAVAKRLLVTAANLCVTQDAEDHAAATALIRAAQRILGVALGKPAAGFTVPTHAEVQAYVANQRILEMRNAAVKENDKWRSWAGEIGGRPDWNGHDSELRALVMDRFASIKQERDQSMGQVDIADHANVRKQVAAALSDSFATAAYTLRELIAKLIQQRDSAITNYEQFRGMHSHAEETITKTRAVLDAALGTIKGPTTFSLEDIAAELVLQRDHLNNHINAQHAAAREWTQYGNPPTTRAAVAERANIQSLLDKALKGRDEVIKERDAHAATIEALRRTIEEAKSTPVAKAKPQPGDTVVGEDALETGCLYSKTWGGCRFVMMTSRGASALLDHNDGDLHRGLSTSGSLCPPAWAEDGDQKLTLVARDLGTDPDAWCTAMREWTANRNRPSPSFKVGDTLTVACEGKIVSVTVTPAPA